MILEPLLLYIFALVAQVVWGNTELVGCGVKQCRSGDWTYTLVLCNYNPQWDTSTQHKIYYLQ